MWWILTLLRSADCHVTLFPFDRQPRQPYTGQLQRAGIEVRHGEESFASFAGHRRDSYSLVILSRPGVAFALLDDTRRFFPGATVVYDSVDLESVRSARKLGLLNELDAQQVEWERARELDCVRRSDIVSVVTNADAEQIHRHLPSARTLALPNVHAVDPAMPKAFDERADLLFIGGFRHDPNVDAVRYFAREIFPLIRTQIDARLVVLGSNPPEEIRALDSSEVQVTGYLADVEDYFRSARVFVAPLRYGSGMKGKIGHAMSFGLPIATTTVGAEGMGLEDGVHALIRDTPVEFAEAVVRAYCDRETWETLSRNSRRLVGEVWAPQVMAKRLERLLAIAARLPTVGD